MAKEAKKNTMVEKIIQIHNGSRKSYGSPRVFQILKGMGEKISKPTVERLMRVNDIKARTKRRFKVTTDSKHDFSVAKKIFESKF
jgi:putative transposase